MGHFTIELPDAEIWQQDAGDTALAHWTGPASKYLISIREGSFGSANLDVHSDGKVFKVHRIR